MGRFSIVHLFFLLSSLFTWNVHAKEKVFSLEKASTEVDRLIQNGYRKHKLSPSLPSSDAVFLRRVYLDIIGRIPTHKEVVTFLNEKTKNKRSLLIAELLDSPGYAHHYFNFWANLLRMKSDIRGIYANEYAEWLMASLLNNKSYDQIIRDLLNAEGSVAKNGAVGFYLRDEQQKMDTVSTSTQVFLGLQIGCAQCHDHPFDKWTQKEYYGLAAYLAPNQTRLRARRKSGMRGLKNKMKELVKTQQQRDRMNKVLRSASFYVHHSPKKGLRLKPKEGKGKGELIAPSLPFAQSPKLRKGERPVEALSRWLTTEHRHEISRVFVNRIWKHIMGIGLIEPVDDIQAHSTAYNPELLEHLTKTFLEVQFDIKKLLACIFNSKTYQLRASSKNIPMGDYYSQAHMIRRMSAEQLWDSLLTLSTDDIDDKFIKAPPAAKQKSELFMNIQEAVIRRDPKSAYKSIAKSLEATASSAMMSNRSMRRYQIKKSRYARASQVRSPAPFGHLLNNFGQSDREVISQGDRTPQLPQVLTLMNGKITDSLTQSESHLTQQVLKLKDLDSRVDRVYLSILTRYPSSREKEIAANHLLDHEWQGYQDLIFALINSREFLFIQ